MSFDLYGAGPHMHLFGRALEVTIRCHYNTMSTQDPVRFGEGSDKEMCLVIMFVVRR